MLLVSNIKLVLNLACQSSKLYHCCPSVVTGTLQSHGLYLARLLHHGISQARILEQVAISFSRGSSQPKDRTYVSCTVGRFFTSEPLGESSVCVCVCVCMRACHCPFYLKDFFFLLLDWKLLLMYWNETPSIFFCVRW